MLHLVFRVAAILLLLMVGAGAYACGLSDACYSTAPGGPAQGGDCDQPFGDNCICCCHHIVPAVALRLDAAGVAIAAALPPLVANTASIPLPIDHPPKLG